MLDRWIRAGLASWSGDGRVAITRSAIEQLAAGRPDSPQARLVSMLEAGAEPEEVSAEARRIGAELARTGHLERALAVLDAAELWARGTPAERELLEDRVTWSLGLETAQAAERALYRVRRAEIDPERRLWLETLLQGARAALGGDPVRALQCLARKPEGLPEPLEIYWHAVRWKAASQLDFEAHEAELAAMEPWARVTTERASKWRGWYGYLRYRQRRYEEAAALLLEAARTRAAPRERAQMLYMGSAALLELGDHAAARRAGEEARALFREGRHAMLEGLAVSILRMIDLRTDRTGRPDVELVDAAAAVSPAIEGQLALVEAGVAFRRGDTALCATLATRARGALRSSVGDPSLALAEALLAAIAPDALDPEPLVARVGALTPQIGAQVLGLLARGHGPRAAWRERAAALLPALGQDPDARLELVSIREVRLWLGLEGSACRTT